MEAGDLQGGLFGEGGPLDGFEAEAIAVTAALALFGPAIAAFVTAIGTAAIAIGGTGLLLKKTGIGKAFTGAGTLLQKATGGGLKSGLSSVLKMLPSMIGPLIAIIGVALLAWQAGKFLNKFIAPQMKKFYDKKDKEAKKERQGEISNQQKIVNK